jgi:hypothetical protein
MSSSKKNAEERAEDVAYTINHALACTATDFIDPYVGNVTQKFLGRRISIGCGHDHSHDHASHADGHPCKHDHHHHHGHEHSHAAPRSHLKHWWIGEVVGDFGAVPITVAAQYMFPDAMRAVGSGMEMMLGGFFRMGAARATRAWAREHGVDSESQAYLNHFNATYRYEIDHLPQALLWTGSSIALNLGTQKLMGNAAPLWHLAAGKATGASISAALVVATRGMMPDTAHAWDRFTSRNIFLPATKGIGSLIGIRKETVDRMAEKHEALKTGWADRMDDKKTTETGRAY